MEKLRELLLLLLKHHEENKFPHGLCNVVYDMYHNEIINRNDMSILLHYIKNKAMPKWYQLRYYCECGIARCFIAQEAYYWNENDHKARTKWLKKHIKLNTNL